YAALGLIGALFYSRLPRAEAADTAPRATALGPSRRRVYKLAALFSLDAFAGGFTVQSLMALWLFERFDLSLAAASAFFFWSNVRADAHVLRDGGGDPGRTHGGRERHRSSAQLSIGDQSGHVRRAIVDLLSRTAAHPLRRAEDRLRSLSPLFVSTHKAAGGERGVSMSFLGASPWLRDKRVH